MPLGTLMQSADYTDGAKLSIMLVSLPMQNPRTMDSPAPSCMLVKILARQPAVLINAVIRLS